MWHHVGSLKSTMMELSTSQIPANAENWGIFHSPGWLAYQHTSPWPISPCQQIREINCLLREETFQLGSHQDFICIRNNSIKSLRIHFLKKHTLLSTYHLAGIVLVPEPQRWVWYSSEEKETNASLAEETGKGLSVGCSRRRTGIGRFFQERSTWPDSRKRMLGGGNTPAKAERCSRTFCSFVGLEHDNGATGKLLTGCQGSPEGVNSIRTLALNEASPGAPCAWSASLPVLSLLLWVPVIASHQGFWTWGRGWSSLLTTDVGQTPSSNLPSWLLRVTVTSVPRCLWPLTGPLPAFSVPEWVPVFKKVIF